MHVFTFLNRRSIGFFGKIFDRKYIQFGTYLIQSFFDVPNSFLSVKENYRN